MRTGTVVANSGERAARGARGSSSRKPRRQSTPPSADTAEHLAVERPPGRWDVPGYDGPGLGDRPITPANVRAAVEPLIAAARDLMGRWCATEEACAGQLDHEARMLFAICEAVAQLVRVRASEAERAIEANAAQMGLARHQPALLLALLGARDVANQAALEHATVALGYAFGVVDEPLTGNVDDALTFYGLRDATLGPTIALGGAR